MPHNFTMTPKGQDALSGVLALLGNYEVLDEIAGKFTCSEVEDLAKFIAVWGTPEAAGVLLRAHATGDEFGDQHQGWGHQEVDELIGGWR